MNGDNVAAVDELLQDTDPYDPAADKARAMGEAAAAALRGLGMRSVGELGWLDPGNEAPPLRALLTIEGDTGPEPFMPAGITAMLAAPGATGKGHCITQLAVAVAGGLPWLGTYHVVDPGPVALLVGEDKADEMHRRLRGAVRALGAWDAKSQIDANLYILPLVGMDVRLTGDSGAESDFYKTVRAGLAAAGVEWRLVILDPASRFLGPDCELDNAAATRWIEAMERLTDLSGNPTVLFAHHTNKGALAGSTDQGAARGSSALTDGVRWQANLDRVTEPELGGDGKPTGKRLLVPDRVTLKVVKVNHCRMNPALALLRDRDHGGFLRSDPFAASSEPASRAGDTALRPGANAAKAWAAVGTQTGVVSTAERLAREAADKLARHNRQQRPVEPAERLMAEATRRDLDTSAKAAAKQVKAATGKLAAMRARLAVSEAAGRAACEPAGRDRASGRDDDL